MRRRVISPRENWRSLVEQHGLIFHSTENGPYWNESAYYEFSSREIDELERASSELLRLYLEAAEHVIRKKRYAELGIPEEAVERIEESWESEPPAIYGRFDLAFDGISPPKLLEYNADTPTSLLEAAIIQWYWQQDRFPDADQWNSLHEALVEKWKDIKPHLKSEPLYFTHVAEQSGEDLMTVMYLRETAELAGIECSTLPIHNVGWNPDLKEFRDESDLRIGSMFKLYPWEWLVREEFGKHMLATYDRMQWIEPIWKMLWSNKGILAILWEMFPGHPNLLETHRDSPRGMSEYVKKPILSREGANITVHTLGGDTTTDGDYGDEGFVFQALGPIQVLGGHRPVIGSWMIDGVPCGMGIRESTGQVTTNTAQFVPHIFTT